MDEVTEQVPAELRKRLTEVLAVTDAFCAKHLTAEYRDLCRELAVVCCNEGLPVTSGKAAGWAAGIVAAVGFVNFLGDPSQPHHMKQDDMATAIGVSPATLQNKLRAIRDALDISRWDPQFSTKQSTERNPLTWLIELKNGMIIDVRTQPREVQEAAVKAGLIPYLPPPSRDTEKE